LIVSKADVTTCQEEMGCCTSAEDAEKNKRNAEIENQIKKDKLTAQTEVKMLLLGIFFNVIDIL
jgi:hypothetical protein